MPSTTMRILGVILFLITATVCEIQEPDSVAVKTCKAFIESNPQPIPSRFEALEYQESFLVFKNNYDMISLDNYIKFSVHKQNLLFSKEGTEITTLCLGMEEMMSRITKKDDQHSNVARVLIYPRRDIPAGVVNITTECWLQRKRTAITYCNPVFYPMPGLMNMSLFVHSPMEQEFWTQLNDEQAFHKDWVLRILMRINDGAFPSSWLQKLNVSTLQELEIWGNPMERPQSLFGFMPQLEVLRLTNSSMQQLPPNMFGNSTSDITSPQFNISQLPLVTLDLSNNNLTTLPAHTFSYLSNLENLILRNNSFETCPEESFVYLTHLTYLHMSGNKLSKLPTTCFRKISQITILFLSNNNISSLAVGVFKYLENLKHLDLSQNKLTDFDTSLYSTLKNLKTLDLYSNQIKTILVNPAPGTVFRKQNIHSKNEFIDLDSFWNNHTQYKFKHLKFLNISHNFIDTVTNETLKYLQYINVVDIGQNSFNCCYSSTPILKEWLTSSKVLNLNSKTPFTCTLNNPSLDQYILIKDFVYTEDTCKLFSETEVGLGIQLWVPLGLFAIVVAVVIIILYTHRFELTYMNHLFKMKKRGMETDENRYSVCNYDAFVCYSGKDFLWVKDQLLPQLENGPEGYRLCLHDRDFALGAAIDTNIVMSIEKSRKVIIILTQDFINSRWCQWELEMANHKTFEESRDYVILIELERLDRRSLPRHLRYLMDTRTYLEWPQDSTDGRRIGQTWRRLKEAMGDSIMQRTGKKPVKHTTVLDP